MRGERGLLNKGEINKKLEENLKFGVRQEPSEDAPRMGQVPLKRSSEMRARCTLTGKVAMERS